MSILERVLRVSVQWPNSGSPPNSTASPKTIAGYRCLLDTVVLPTWTDVSLKRINYESYSTWLGGLSVDGGQRGTGLSASRITQAHQLVGAVLKYAQRTGRVAKNVALEIKRDEDLPEQAERERRYLDHAELLTLARATDRFERLTLVLGYCGLRFGEAVALRRKHVGDRVLTVRSSATAVTGKGIVESTTKTKRDRHVPVPEPVWQRLHAELPAAPNALAFPGRKGGTSRPEAHHGVLGDQCRR
jgi:integrase